MGPHFVHRRDVSRIVGSQRSQITSDTRPLPASIGAARWPVRLHLAPSGDGQIVPSKQRAAGSNPARRAGRRHITIPCSIVRSPTGANGRCSGTSSARGTETRLPRCQRHAASVITARLPACVALAKHRRGRGKARVICAAAGLPTPSRAGSCTRRQVRPDPWYRAPIAITSTADQQIRQPGLEPGAGVGAS